MLNKIKLALGGLFALIGASAMGTVYFTGSGTIHVHAPMDTAIVVALDDQAPQQLAPGQHFQGTLDQGEHVVGITTPDGQVTTHGVDVSSGFWEQLVPANSHQCWVKVDARAYYEGSSGPPSVDDRFGADAPIDVGGSMYFSEADLPQTIQEGHPVYLMWEIPCELMGADSATVLRAIGYQL